MDCTLPTTTVELADQINQEHAAATTAATRAVHHAIRAGKLLIAAKEQIGHGGWAAWLSESFKGSERTAQVYMRLARHRKKLKAQGSALLSIDAALQSLASVRKFSTPEEVEAYLLGIHWTNDNLLQRTRLEEAADFLESHGRVVGATLADSLDEKAAKIRELVAIIRVSDLLQKVTAEMVIRCQMKVGGILTAEEIKEQQEILAARPTFPRLKRKLEVVA